MSKNKAPSSKPKLFPKVTPVADIAKSPSVLTGERMREVLGRCGEMLTRLRAVITGTDLEVAEEWRCNVPMWSCQGILCTGEAYTKSVKLTYAKGAALADPSRLLHASMEGNVRHAMDFSYDANIDDAALATLGRAAIADNMVAAGAKSNKVT